MPNINQILLSKTHLYHLKATVTPQITKGHVTGFCVALYFVPLFIFESIFQYIAVVFASNLSINTSRPRSKQS